ncbi:hypothetical protein R1flu_003873 [Riccia fluitans]|uniref:Ribosomal protein S14 n=1 Tax=Riccia fluitans TaxID=41844 RepID=A0ABD1YA82_9MARC
MNRGIEEARSSRAILISHGTTATSMCSAFSVAFPGEPTCLVRIRLRGDGLTALSVLAEGRERSVGHQLVRGMLRRRGFAVRH